MGSPVLYLSLTRGTETRLNLDMWTIILTVSCVVLQVPAEPLDVAAARILKEQRYNAGDGRFGSAYAQEDGTVSREETSADGERMGQYSYIDTQGNTVTVRYTAGKDGFRILEGDHVPAGADGLNSAPYNPHIGVKHIRQEEKTPVIPKPLPRTSRTRPASVTTNAVHFNAGGAVNKQVQPAFQPQQIARAAFQPQQSVQQAVRPAFQPQQVANPAFQAQQAVQPAIQPTTQIQRKQPQQFVSSRFANSVPACANCNGLNPFINPADPSHSALFKQQSFQPSQQPASTFSIQQPIQPAYLQQPQQQNLQSQQFQTRQPQFQQQQQFQPQQRFQPHQQFQPQQQFQPKQQFRRPSAEELAHQRLGQAQIQEAVRLQNCLSNPSTSGC